MDDFVIPAPEIASITVKHGGRFPVRRIFCIGKNYADHVREMGGDPKSDPPVFFTKPADAAINASIIPFPPMTDDLHFEGELVVALKAGGADIDPAAAHKLIFGFAAGCDLTRRDHQVRAKKRGGPWDTAKAFDHSAPIGEIVRAESADLNNCRLVTRVNGAVRQDEALSSMIWSIPEIIVELSKLFELKAGDLILTGTPSGVGALEPGDSVEIAIGETLICAFTMGEAG